MLEVAGITKTYPAATGELRVLDGVGFTLEPRGRLAVMGPSGSGKSTLLSIIGGLDEPTAGTVRLDGVDPFAGDATERARFRNRRIGFVFQEHHLLDGCTAIDNVLVPALASGSAPLDLVARAAKLLERVGLGPHVLRVETAAIAVAARLA